METRWSNSEENVLRQLLFKNVPIFDIAQELGRKPISIILHTRALFGLECPDSKQRDIEDYIDGTAPSKDVSPNSQHKWGKKEKDLLQKLFYYGANIFQISDKLKRDPNAVIRQLERLYSKKSDIENLFKHAKFILERNRVPIFPWNDEVHDNTPHLFIKEDYIETTREEIAKLSFLINNLDYTITSEDWHDSMMDDWLNDCGVDEFPVRYYDSPEYHQMIELFHKIEKLFESDHFHLKERFYLALLSKMKDIKVSKLNSSISSLVSML